MCGAHSSEISSVTVPSVTLIRQRSILSPLRLLRVKKELRENGNSLKLLLGQDISQSVTSSLVHGRHHTKHTVLPHSGITGHRHLEGICRRTLPCKGVDKADFFYFTHILHQADITVSQPESFGIRLYCVFRATVSIGRILFTVFCQTVYDSCTVVTYIEVISASQHSEE